MLRVCELLLWAWFVSKSGDLVANVELSIDWGTYYCEEYTIGWMARIVGIVSD